MAWRKVVALQRTQKLGWLGLAAVAGAAATSWGQVCDWSTVASPSTDRIEFGQIYALAIHDDGIVSRIYAGGINIELVSSEFGALAQWDGLEWSLVLDANDEGLENGSIPAKVNAIAVYDDGTGPAVYAGGLFSGTASVAANNIVKWDGADWSPLVGTQITELGFEVRSLVVFDDGSGSKLYAAGDIPGGIGGKSVTPSGIAAWDGSDWSLLEGSFGEGVGDGGGIYDMAVYDDGDGPALFVVGIFDTAGGLTVNNVAKWDGAEWHALAGPSCADPSCIGIISFKNVYATTVYDDGNGPALYVGGGAFDSAGGMPADGLARWNGSDWSVINTGFTPFSQPSKYIQSMTTFYTGSEVVLVVAGAFDDIDDLQDANNIAAWNGHEWVGLGTGITSSATSVRALLGINEGNDQDLYAAGFAAFFGSWEAGGNAMDGPIARWSCFCPADLTGPAGDGVPDGFVNAFDLDYYVSLWLANDPAADITGPAGDGIPDGFVNAFDLDYYIDLWLGGC